MDQHEPIPEPEETPGWRSRLRERWVELYERNALLRHLVHEPLFLAAVLALVFAALGVGLMLPKRWNAAPAGFSKSVRISLLDYVQAWSLRRAARRAEGEGRWEDALAAWRGAIANNMADPRSFRGTLELLRDAPWARSANLGLVFASAEFLRELERTNRTDALLIADVMERHRLPEFALEQLRPWEKELAPAEEAVWIRALLTAGRIPEFLARWERSAARLEADPLLRLYRAAYDAGWGGVDRSASGREVLGKASEDASTALVAARLRGAVALRREDAEGYSRVLEFLNGVQSAMVQDHAAWWELLRRQGRTEEARKLAEAYGPLPPPTPIEAVTLARAWLALGLQERAISFFKDHASHYGMSLEVWSTYLDLLMLKGDWKEVRRVAADLRASASRQDDLLPVSLYADIRADLAENRRTIVRENLQRLREKPGQNPNLIFRFASGLNASGEYETARVLLASIESQRAEVPEYWFEVLANAQGRRDVEAMKAASARLLKLVPGHPTARTLRLVVLLGTRSEPGEALAISLGLVSEGGKQPTLLINHAMALLLNRRADEALEVLARIDPNGLPADARNSWRVAMTDALIQLGRHPEAVAVGETVDHSALLEEHSSWLRDSLAAAKKQAAASPPPNP